MTAYVTTFYSFKGGVGRTTLLVNAACVLADRGERVLLWDLDLEAPGVHWFPGLGPPEPLWQSGFLEWLGGTPPCPTPEPTSTWPSEAWLNMLGDRVYAARGEYRGAILVLPALGTHANLGSRYAAVDWNALFVEHPDHGLHLLRRACDALIARFEPSFVLIDSRTGVSDLGGFLTGLLPDCTVLVGNYGVQSTEGLRSVHLALDRFATERVQSELHRHGKLERLLVASPVPVSLPARERGRERWSTGFPGVAPRTSFEIPLVEDLLYAEDVLVRTAPSSDAARAYEAVAERLIELRSAHGRSEAWDRAEIDRPTRIANVERLLQLLGFETAHSEDADLVAREQTPFGERSYRVTYLAGTTRTDAFHQVLDRQRTRVGSAADLPLLIVDAARGDERSAAQAAGVALRTVRDLEDQLVDLRAYVSAIRGMFEGSELVRSYVPQPVVAGDTTDDGLAVVMRWVAGHGPRLLLLVGDAGSGKTSFLRRLAYELATRREADPTLPVPLLINLGLAEPNATVASLLQQHLQATIGWRGNAEAILYLLHAGRLVLLFDDLEALGTAPGIGVHDRLRWLTRSTTAQGSVTANRILVTARSQLRAATDEMVDRAVGSGAAEVVELAPFGLSQVASYLDYKLGGARAKTALARIRAVPALAPLASQPRLLHLLASVVADRDDALDEDSATASSLYDRYVARWIDAKPHSLALLPDQRAQVLERLAAELWQRGRDESPAWLPIAALREGLPEDAAADQLDLELRTAAFLTRAPDASYRFAHRGFLEYFFARHLARCIANGSEALRNALATTLLTPPCVALLAELVAASSEARSAIESAVAGPYTTPVSDNALWIMAALQTAPGADLLAIASTLETLGMSFHAQGAYAKAESAFRRALLLREQVLPSEHLDVATSLNNLAVVYQAQGAYARAEPLYERALRIRERALGVEDPEVAISLNNLAVLYQAQGDHARAAPLLERALRIDERAHGTEHPAIAASLGNLASHYQALGAYARAEPLLARALAIREQALGPEHPDVATSLNNLAMLYQAQGALVQAAPLYERALRIRESARGAMHPDVATSLDNLARLYQDQGALAEARPLHERALDIRERVLGIEHPDVAASLNNLATLHQAQGALAEAAPLYERALRIREHVLGTEHPDVATSLDNLAGLYQARGSFPQAALLYERALRMRELVFGTEHPDVATSLDNLASLLQDQGAYAQAEPLYRRAVHIRELVFGSEHPDVATSLNNLASLLQDQGAYAEAEPLYVRALHVREQLLGTEHPDVATSLDALAGLYQALGEYPRAEPLCERALDLRKRVLGAEHPDVATSLDHLAALCQAKGDHVQAALLYERAVHIREQLLGAEHPAVAASLRSLAVVCWSMGAVSRAHGYFARAVALRERQLGVALAGLSETRKRRLLLTQRGDADLLASFHAHGVPDDDDALALVLTASLQHKGRILEEVSSDQAALRRNLSPALQGELDTLQQRRAELATRRQAASGRDDADTLQTLAQEVERLEGELSRKSAAFRIHAEPPTIATVQAALPSDTALVEFVHYRRFDPASSKQPWLESRYAAYILPQEGPPRWVNLGTAEPIEAAIADVLSGLTRHPGDDVRAPLRNLDELVFAPIRRLLGPIDRVLISPDAALHLVPFAALIDEGGRHLVERLLITYVTSGRDLMRRAVQTAARSKPLVVAAPEVKGDVSRLLGAEAEASAVQKHFADVDLYVGAAATKNKLTAARGPVFLHVATYGFFRRPLTTRDVERDVAGFERDAAIAPSLPLVLDRPDIEDVLDDAGLILAGSSDAEATLTAREIAAIDLRGTQLVVLAANDTGVGQIARSEGVYGLRRALAIAGAETQVVSLGNLDDRATSLLMDHYYRGLRSGEGRSEALRQAQLKLMHDGQHAHPFYWATFVAIGDERPLRLARSAPPEHAEVSLR